MTFHYLLLAAVTSLLCLCTTLGAQAQVDGGN